MDFTLMAALIIALIFIASIATTSGYGSKAENDAASSKEKNNRNNRSFEESDEQIIGEILRSKEISRIEIEQLPWRNRKYKGHSSERLHEMHENFMGAASAARVSRNEGNASKFMSKVGDINAEFMIRRQIQIYKMSKEPINIDSHIDKTRLDYLLEEKLKNHRYKVQTDGGNYNFDYENIINDQLKYLQSKYKELGYDEASSDLQAKCELLSIALKSEPSLPRG